MLKTTQALANRFTHGSTSNLLHEHQVKLLNLLHTNNQRVKIVEVSARDGLQSEKPLSVAQRVKYVNLLNRCGFKHIEVGALVKLPSMADSDEVLRLVDQPQGVDHSLLVLNARGLERALEQGSQVKEIAVGVSPSDAFCLNNAKRNAQQMLSEAYDLADLAKKYGIKVRAYVSTAVHCPFQGYVDLERVADLAWTLKQFGCYEISLGDTTGRATPRDIDAMLSALEHRGVPLSMCAGHFHDTYGQGLANVYTALQRGVRTFDASISGLGGCPYAPGASGNVATEDLLHLLHGCGFDSGVSMDRALEAGAFICGELGIETRSSAAKALLGAR